MNAWNNYIDNTDTTQNLRISFNLGVVLFGKINNLDIKVNIKGHPYKTLNLTSWGTSWVI